MSNDTRLTILAIDTSTDYLSLALMRGPKIIARFHRRSHMRHSSLLIPMIGKILKKSGITPKSVDCFAVSIGPGSFTGLRIGVATVKGLAYALDKRIVMIPTLDVIARNVRNFEGVICPVLDARKNKVYAAFYRSDDKDFKRISEYLLLSVNELMEKTAQYDKIVFLGDALHLIGKAASKKIDWHPKADVVARLGAELYAEKKFVSAEDLEPMYLYSHECDIT